MEVDISPLCYLLCTQLCFASSLLRAFPLSCAVFCVSWQVSSQGWALRASLNVCVGTLCPTEHLQQADQLEMLGIFQLKLTMLFSTAWRRNTLNTDNFLFLPTKFLGAWGQLVLIFLSQLFMVAYRCHRSGLALDLCALKRDICFGPRPKNTIFCRRTVWFCTNFSGLPGNEFQQPEGLLSKVSQVYLRANLWVSQIHMHYNLFE